MSTETIPSAIRQALVSGAAGYVAKHASKNDVLDAIRRVASGSRYVDPELGGDPLQPTRRVPDLGGVREQLRPGPDPVQPGHPRGVDDGADEAGAFGVLLEL